MKKLFPIILLFVSFCSLSQENLPAGKTGNKKPEAVTWKFTSEISKDNKEEIILIAEAAIAKDCHIYSQEVSADGPIPTSLQFKKDSLNYVLIGKTEEVGAEKKFDGAFQADVSSFSDKAIFRQKVKRISKNAFAVSGELEFMYCNATQCFPPKTVPFSFSVPAK